MKNTRGLDRPIQYGEAQRCARRPHAGRVPRRAGKGRVTVQEIVRSPLLAESASQNIGSGRDTVSQTGLNRKLRPSLRPQNGTQFPPDQPSPPFRHSATRISNSVHRKYMNICSIYTYLPAHFLSKNFATPKTQSRQGFSCPTVGT